MECLHAKMASHSYIRWVTCLTCLAVYLPVCPDLRFPDPHPPPSPPAPPCPGRATAEGNIKAFCWYFYEKVKGYQNSHYVHWTRVFVVASMSCWLVSDLVDGFIAGVLQPEVDHSVLEGPAHVELQGQIIHPLDMWHRINIMCVCTHLFRVFID